MKTFRMLRTLAAEIIAAAPRNAAASILLTLSLSAAEVASLAMLIPLLVLVGVGKPSSELQSAEWLSSVFSALDMAPTLGGALVLFAGVAGLRALLMRWQLSVNAGVREDVTANMRVRVYRAIARAEWKFLVTRRPSEFVNALVNEIGRVGSAAYQVVALSVAVSVALVYLGVALHLSPVMTLMVLVSAALMAWVLRGSMTHAQATGSRASAVRGKLHAAATEHVASLKTVKSYGAIERHDELFVGLSHEVHDASLRVISGQSELQQRLEFGSTVLLATIAYLAHEMLRVTPAQLLVLLFIFARLMPRLTSIYRQLQALAGMLPVVEAVARLERDCLAMAEPEASQISDPSFEKCIRLEGVSFNYLQRADTPAVCNADLEIPAGLTTAIVGPSGAGKTTLADLLIGLLSPTGGRILVDGAPLPHDRLAAWRRHVGYVAQETMLFHDTVRANLLWANPGASEEDLLQALRLSAADDFVAGLPDGLDTILGERGVLVSGGERQRLSLARAILRRPRMLVLDEATSSLDSENELRIQQAIESLHQQMTIVVITHRLSTIRHADLIHVLEHGRIVESGSWDALMARPGGRFRKLCRAQGIDDRPALRPVPFPVAAP
jgi:ATP-binding cassette subfamily C protein